MFWSFSAGPYALGDFAGHCPLPQDAPLPVLTVRKEEPVGGARTRGGVSETLRLPVEKASRQHQALVEVRPLIHLTV